MTAGNLVLKWAAAGLLAIVVAVPASAQSVESLADALSDCPTAGVTQVNPDGTRPDVPCTRQWVKGKVVRQDINMSFEKGSARLTASAMGTLDRFAAALRSIGSFRSFSVEGHTDSSGSRALNAALSQSRATAVVGYLAGKGVDRSRMSARGFGFDRPLSGRNAADPANRRVEVVAR
ncbi:OmpA family protein [Sandarakinorhabdus sp.]|uniref:OmpA family protein n=1 Tax=Sandarakinorhabdus sp. TaxID=1916663 RepID=UPI00286D6B28|nr:OmpA family protein [Sandarakinorhabdus sp.]